MVTVVAGVLLLGLLSSCGSDQTSAAPDVVSAGPQLFIEGGGAVVSTGTSGREVTADGSVLYWLTATDATVSVLNGSARDGVVRVSASAIVPCQTSVQLVLTLPSGRTETVDVAPGQPVAVQFLVRVPARGAVDVPAHVQGDACHPPADSRTLYVGLLGLRARLTGGG